jgi:hypothetical protein
MKEQKISEVCDGANGTIWIKSVLIFITCIGQLKILQ